MQLLRKLFQISVFILQFVIAGYFLFNSTFIHAHFLTRLSENQVQTETGAFELPDSKMTPAEDQTPAPGSSKKSNSKSTDNTLYFHILTMAGFYLLLPVDFRMFRTLLSFLKRFFAANNSPPDIFQYYLFRGPPTLPH